MVFWLALCTRLRASWWAQAQDLAAAPDPLNLPGYQGHDQVHAFAGECARGVPDETRADAQALQAELSRRVALLSESQIAPA